LPATDEAIQAAVTACAAADDKKASDVLVLEVADILNVVDLFVVASATTDRQLRAVADEVERKLREDLDRRPLRREGDPASGWMLLDYGDIVCHLFEEERRDYYALERLWSDVPRRDPQTGEPHTARMAQGSR
jgi:ribosome-associated protein